MYFTPCRERNAKMLNVDTSGKVSLGQLCYNIFSSCGYTVQIIVVLLVADAFSPGTAMELCGGIRNRFVCDDQDPTVFHICLGNNQYTMVCPGTLHFNVRTQNCDWPKSVNCVQEAMSRQPAGTFSPALSPFPAPNKTEYSVTQDQDSSTSRTRSLQVSTSSSETEISDLNSTEYNVKASVGPFPENTSHERPNSRYRLKVVPGLDKPIESLLTADEKVIEEVKKLSEELKHIDNYLQSLESDQVGFMIEPYKASFPRRRQLHTNRYLHTTSRKHITPPYSPYRNRWASSKSPFRKTTSPSTYTPNDTYYRRTKTEDNPTHSTAPRVVSPAPRTSSPYKPTTKRYRDNYVPTAYRWHNIPESAAMYRKRILNKKIENNLVQKRSYVQKPKEINRIDQSYSTRFRSLSNNNKHILASLRNGMSPRVQTMKPNVTKKTNLPHQSTANLVSSPSSSWSQNSHTSQTIYDNKSKRLEQTGSGSAPKQPIKYSAIETRVAHSTSQSLPGRTSMRNGYGAPNSHVPASSTHWWSTTRSSSSPASPASYSFSQSTAAIPQRKHAHESPQQSTKPVNENTQTVTKTDDSPLSIPWWSSTQADYKFTNVPDTPRPLAGMKNKNMNYFPKPNYNTRTPDSDFVLVPSNDKATFDMSNTAQEGQNSGSINAAAALERNFALHTIDKTKEDEERRFSLHKVNAAASVDNIALYKPNDKAKSKIDAPAQIDKLIALQTFEEDSKADVISVYKSPIEKYDTKIGKCTSSWCKLPDCRCIGQDIPGDLEVNDVPQMVMLTFDDSINNQNIDYYKGLYNGTIRNPNGCPIKSTFFVSGDSSDYQMVKRIHKQGHEIASHTLTHRNPTTWWASAGFDSWEKEVVGMRDILQEKSGVPVKEITGMRAPFLQVGGDAQYAMLKENKFRYDSSMVTGNLYSNNKPPIWPFTLDTPPDGKTCSLTPCPTRSYPGLWEVPLVRWYGSNHIACAMPDACTIDLGTKGSRKFIEDNFNRHYLTNRAPFGIFIHASWFGRKDGNFQGLFEFLASLADKEDVWVVTLNQMLDWIQRPVKASALNSLETWSC